MTQRLPNILVSLGSGLVFGFGLSLSGMLDPARIQGFLDIFGRWDPSLAFVMGGGLLVNLIAFRFILRRKAPLFAPSFALPQKTKLDPRLIGGAALFGVGWGLGGFCPGPALVSLASGATPVLAFVLSMLAAMALFDALDSRATERALTASAKR